MALESTPHEATMGPKLRRRPLVTTARDAGRIPSSPARSYVRQQEMSISSPSTGNLRAAEFFIAEPSAVEKPDAQVRNG